MWDRQFENRWLLFYCSCITVHIYLNYFVCYFNLLLGEVARFSDVHAFGYNSAESERIWMKFLELRVYCLELALTDFGRDPRRSESGRPCGSFFLSGKQRATLPISVQPNFMKFAHKTWFCEVVNPFGIIFWKFALKGSSFPKNRDHRQRFPTSSRDFSEMITNLGKSWQVGAPMECWLSIRTVGINSKSFAWPAGCARERTFLDIGGVHRMTFIDASLPNVHAVSACSLDVTLHYYSHSRGAAAPFGRCVIVQPRVD